MSGTALPASDDELLLLHNPRCSKSRATLALLDERGVRPQIREYLQHPLTRAELDSLATRLARPAHEWVRKGEGAFTEAGCSEKSSDEELLTAVSVHPILMERPILVRGGRAVIGRPPEDVLALL